MKKQALWIVAVAGLMISSVPSFAQETAPSSDEGVLTYEQAREVVKALYGTKDDTVPTKLLEEKLERLKSVTKEQPTQNGSQFVVHISDLGDLFGKNHGIEDGAFPRQGQDAPDLPSGGGEDVDAGSGPSFGGRVITVPGSHGPSEEGGTGSTPLGAGRVSGTGADGSGGERGGNGGGRSGQLPSFGKAGVGVDGSGPTEGWESAAGFMDPRVKYIEDKGDGGDGSEKPRGGGSGGGTGGGGTGGGGTGGSSGQGGTGGQGSGGSGGGDRGGNGGGKIPPRDYDGSPHQGGHGNRLPVHRDYPKPGPQPDPKFPGELLVH